MVSWSHDAVTDVEAVLHRLETDAAFRDQLTLDPVGALAGYETTAADLARIGSRLAELTEHPAAEVPRFLDLCGGDAS